MMHNQPGSAALQASDRRRPCLQPATHWSDILQVTMLQLTYRLQPIETPFNMSAGLTSSSNLKDMPLFVDYRDSPGDPNESIFVGEGKARITADQLNDLEAAWAKVETEARSRADRSASLSQPLARSSSVSLPRGASMSTSVVCLLWLR